MQTFNDMREVEQLMIVKFSAEDRKKIGQEINKSRPDIER